MKHTTVLGPLTILWYITDYNYFLILEFVYNSVYMKLRGEYKKIKSKNQFNLFLLPTTVQICIVYDGTVWKLVNGLSPPQREHHTTPPV